VNSTAIAAPGEPGPRRQFLSPGDEFLRRAKGIDAPVQHLLAIAGADEPVPFTLTEAAERLFATETQPATSAADRAAHAAASHVRQAVAA
jgi:hypothetical protein